MKTTKQIKREVKRMFRLCLTNGTLDEGRVRQVLQTILGSSRRGHLNLAVQFERLVRIYCSKQTANVGSATPLPPDLEEAIRSSLLEAYGPGLTMSVAEDATLIGGMRIKVGDDLYDGSVKAGLAALEKSF